MFTNLFTDQLIEEMEFFGQWSSGQNEVSIQMKEPSKVVNVLIAELCCVVERIRAPNSSSGVSVQ